ncbi:hypothetical protein GCM10029976_044330 [Kribbella albertanoniae]
MRASGGCGPARPKRAFVRRRSSTATRARAPTAGRQPVIADYEADHGVITEDEIAEAERSVQANAIVVRGGRVIRPAADRPH